MKNGQCYDTFTEKKADWPAKTAPMILAGARAAAQAEEQTLGRWMAENGVLNEREPAAILKALHNAARQGVYRETKPRHCDIKQGVANTLSRGGDCDQWAMLILACCRMLEIPAYLVSFGDADDPYQHAAVACDVGETAVILDPKGSQHGADFNVWPDMDTTGGWPA